MRQKATVASLLSDGRAELIVVRQSACSGDCHACGGCGSVKQTLRVTAQNPIAAKCGERVWIESGSAPILKGAALVYLLPLALFLAAYLCAMPLGAWAFAVSAAAFAVGFLPALAYNRRIKREPPTYTIVGHVT